jgi:hypothetical protein
MDDPLQNPLMIEVGNLLTQNEIFEQSGPAASGFQRILIIAERDALIRRQKSVSGRSLVVFPSRYLQLRESGVFPAAVAL